MALRTKAARDAERSRQVRDTWDTFRPALEACQTRAQAKALAATTVAEKHPGRKFYSNLNFYLMFAIPPAGASRDELTLYLDFIRLATDVDPAKAPKMISDLEEAIEKRGPF